MVRRGKSYIYGGYDLNSDFTRKFDCNKVGLRSVRVPERFRIAIEQAFCAEAEFERGDRPLGTQRDIRPGKNWWFPGTRVNDRSSIVQREH